MVYGYMFATRLGHFLVKVGFCIIYIPHGFEYDVFSWRHRINQSMAYY